MSNSTKPLKRGAINCTNRKYNYKSFYISSTHPTENLPVLPVSPLHCEMLPTALTALSCLRVSAAVSPPRYSQTCESAAALTGGEYLCLWGLLWFEGCLRVERDDRAKQKVNVLLELQS